MSYSKIYFTADETKVSNNIYKIYHTSSGEEIDYFKTLSQIREEEPFAFVLNEHYTELDLYDGIRLIEKIRFSYFFSKSISTAPIYIILNTDIEQLIQYDLSFSILFSDSVYIINDENDIKYIEPVTQLTELKLNNIISKIPIHRLDHSDPHSLANEWGPLRLIFAYQLLKGEKTDYISLLANSRLRNHSYYWLLLSRAQLGQLNTEKRAASSRKNILKVWKKFLNKDTKILIIDDELDKGWEEALRMIFIDNPFIKPTFYQPVDRDTNIILAKLDEFLQNEFDLIITDLRLTEEDKSSGSHEDIVNLEGLTGMKVIEKIKSYSPSIPIISLTASNKAWTFRTLENKYGVEDYWIKENPELGLNNLYSLKNIEDLLISITSNISYNQSIKFLWELVDSIEINKGKEDYIQTFQTFFKNVKPKQFVINRLEAILILLKKAYGFISREPFEFNRQYYGFDPIEMAFIYIWGCLNESLLLRYKNNQDNQSFFLDRDKKSKIYAENGELLPFVFKVIPPKDNKINPIGRPTSTQNAILIFTTEYKDLDFSSLFDVIRKKRNKLNFIHGDSTDEIMSAGLDIIMEDLENLTNLLKYLLFLE